ncbi:hypothetical protein [Psychroflexus lacisalsi]|uniref:TonB C-terminal domain-containing protein n=1 Tax=Psychroflexus lacisalsi TaxID=503928 RepID=A0ABN1K5W6_9FLAO|nr:hypothetical protein [Psychroflexus lacisalsi]MBZ9619167.1 hypothetical protein [Psychroflexus lacisalsi]
MKSWFWFLSILLLVSCKDFDLKKQSADQILEKEMKSINWNEVDFYPTFQNCGTITSKAESKTCFESKIKKTINDYLASHQISTTSSTQDTLVIKFFITAEGALNIEEIRIPDKIDSQNPQLREVLKKAISELPEMYPAQKRSVPVSLHTQLPIILK